MYKTMLCNAKCHLETLPMTNGAILDKIVKASLSEKLTFERSE